MEKEKYLRFLEAHQPLRADADQADFETLGEATLYFSQHPDVACIPLFIGVRDFWDDASLYESIESVLALFPKEEVVPHLIKGMQSRYPGVRGGAADVARRFPDEAMLPHLSKTLEDRRVINRLYATAALEAIGTKMARQIAARRLLVEQDAEIRDILQNLAE